MQQRRPERQVHCWVAGTDGPFSGLVLDWRREGAGWAALTVWATGSDDMVSGCVDAEALSPWAEQADAPPS